MQPGAGRLPARAVRQRTLAVCLLFLGLRTLEVGSNLSTVVCFAGGLTLRLAAIRFKWRLPVFSYQQRWEE